MPAPVAPTTKWERTGEPGSAFNGLGRGRGSRGRGGHRGGRGGSRTNPTERTTEDKGHPSKDNPPPQASQPTTEPSVADKLPILPTTHSKVNPPRRPSRGDLPLQAPLTQTRPARRRRPQVSQSSAIDPKVSPAAPVVTQPSIVPATTLTREPPPHLQRHVDVRHDIDALVERVRAVAMDNRPTTPGSHIDWAGEDDDTLPDLNDWGVNTSKFAPGESESISPIILEGLKPLPVLSAPATPSPLRQAATLDNSAIRDLKVNLIKSECQESTPTLSKLPVAVSIAPVASKDVVSLVKVESPEQQKHVYSSNHKPWHPSLPAKPPSASLVPRVNLRPVASPMRHPIYTKPITNTHKESSLPKEAQSAPEQVAVESTPATSPMSVEVVSAIVNLADERETSNTEAPEKSATHASRPDQTDPPRHMDISDDDDSKAEGLEASIHAPKTPAPTESNIPHRTTILRNHWSYKKEASNRYPSLSGIANGDPVNRLKSWNECSGSQSLQNQPPSNSTGSPKSHHRIHATRPIITGDAISRLARTIGQTNSAS